VEQLKQMDILVQDLGKEVKNQRELLLDQTDKRKHTDIRLEDTTRRFEGLLTEHTDLLEQLNKKLEA